MQQPDFQALLVYVQATELNDALLVPSMEMPQVKNLPWYVQMKDSLPQGLVP